MNWDIAVVSVIVSGSVAIVGTLFPLLINLITDSRRWSREQKAAEAEKLNNLTKELIRHLGIVRSGWVEEATGKSWHHTYAECLGAFYAWEQTMWGRCEKPERNRLEGLRRKVEEPVAQTLYDNVPDIIKEVIELCHIVAIQ